jgi:DnaJ-class molecular chaperone
MSAFESICGTCGGTGKKRNDSGKSYSEESCPDCDGTGKIITEETAPEDDPLRQ